MTLTSCQVKLVGHWAPRNFLKELECSQAQIHFQMQLHPCTSPGAMHTSCSACAPPGGVSSLPCLGLGRPDTKHTDLWLSGWLVTPQISHLRYNHLEAEMGPKLWVTKSVSPPVLSKVLCTVTEMWTLWRFLEKVLLRFPLPTGGSHQDLLSSLWQTKSNQAAPNQRSGSQKDGDHFGYPNKRSKDGVSQNGSKFA